MTYRRVVVFVMLLLLCACGGGPKKNAIEIQGPSFQPHTVTLRTLEPGSTPTPTPAATPTPTPTASSTPVLPPQGSSMRTSGGTQVGVVEQSYCWSDQVGSPCKAYNYPAPNQPTSINAKQKEVALLRIDSQVPPDAESVRPYQGSRANYPSQQIDPAQQTDLTINLPPGEWSMDLCATWYNHASQSVCWLFKLTVS